MASTAEGLEPLRTALSEKGFNLDIEGVSCGGVAGEDRVIIIRKTRKHRTQEHDIPMEITLSLNKWNKWDEKKRFANLEQDDFYITEITEGTEEQQQAGIVGRGIGGGDFTGFLKEFLGSVPEFYVMSPTPYWGKVFDCVQDELDPTLIKCKIRQEVLDESPRLERLEALNTFLSGKRFNLDIDGVSFYMSGDRKFVISKNAKNAAGEEIPMHIVLTINRGLKRDGKDEKEFESLDWDDFFIFRISNGTEDQNAYGDVNKGRGIFTGFLKEFLGSVPEFYVMSPTPYWGKVFDCVQDELDPILTKCKIRQGVPGGSAEEDVAAVPPLIISRDDNGDEDSSGEEGFFTPRSAGGGFKRSRKSKKRRSKKRRSKKRRSKKRRSKKRKLSKRRKLSRKRKSRKSSNRC